MVWTVPSTPTIGREASGRGLADRDSRLRHGTGDVRWLGAASCAHAPGDRLRWPRAIADHAGQRRADRCGVAAMRGEAGMIVGGRSLVSRQAHNLKIAGANPAPTTRMTRRNKREAVMDETWVRLVEAVGLGAAMTVFFVWQSWKRESRLAERVTALEQFQENTLVKIVEQTSVTIAHATEALDKNSDSWAALCAELRLRPCLKGAEVVANCMLNDAR